MISHYLRWDGRGQGYTVGRHWKGSKQRAACITLPARTTLLLPALCLRKVTSATFIPWSFLLSLFKLGSVGGRCQEDMETGKEREIGIFIHYSFIHSTEGHNSWRVALSYSHRSCPRSGNCSLHLPHHIALGAEERGLKKSKSRFQEIR